MLHKIGDLLVWVGRRLNQLAGDVHELIGDAEHCRCDNNDPIPFFVPRDDELGVVQDALAVFDRVTAKFHQESQSTHLPLLGLDDIIRVQRLTNVLRQCVIAHVDISLLG